MIINVMKKITILLLLVVSSNVFALKDSDSRKYDECIIESNKDVDHDRNTAKSAEKLCYQKFIETYETAPSASEEQRLTSQNQNSSASDVSYVTFQYENQASDQAKADAKDEVQKNHDALVLKEYDRLLKSGRYPFVAELSCAYAGILAHPNSCFHSSMYGVGTTFEIKNGDFYKMYQYHDLSEVGLTIDNVLHILLEQSFKITTQNSDTFALLNLKIKDSSTGKIIFEQSVGYYRVISVRN
jgi:hypothetical protein